MVTKKTTPTKVPTPKNVVSVELRFKGDKPDEAIAWRLTQPELQAAATIQQWQGDETEVNALSTILSEQIGVMNGGNMKRAEAMLLAQAHTLDALFNNLARKAHKQTGLAQFEAFLRIALKAQSQCRTTLETLSTIKNPPVVFAKQANISHGNQQVNNGTVVPESRAEKLVNQPNELIEVHHGSETMDTRTKSTTGGKDKTMATVD